MKKFIIPLFIILLIIPFVMNMAFTTCFDDQDFYLSAGTCENHADCLDENDEAELAKWTCCVESSGQQDCTENWNYNTPYEVRSNSECHPTPCYYWTTYNRCKGGNFERNAGYSDFAENDTVTGASC